MEQFFTPARRHQDQWENRREQHDTDPPQEFNEVQLAVPLEEFLSYRWDWKDLRAFATCDDKTIWLTDDAFIAIEDTPVSFYFHLDSTNDRMIATIQESSGQEQMLILAHHDLDHPSMSLGEADFFLARDNNKQLCQTECR
jgi:hypothetical protein